MEKQETAAPPIHLEVRRALRHEERVVERLADLDSRTPASPGVSPVRSSTRIPDGVATTVMAALAVYVMWMPLTDDLVPAQVTWTIRWTAIGLGVLLLGLRRVPLRGSLPAWLFLALVATFAATSPWWSPWTVSITNREKAWLGGAGTVTAAVVLLGGGTRTGVAGVRRMWVAVLATLVPVGLWETTTRQHLFRGEWAPPAWSPAATFSNPNDFAVLLTVGLGIAAVSMSEKMSTARRLAWGLLAASCLVLVWFTVSRLALAACLVMVALGLHLWLRRTGAWARAMRRIGRWGVEVRRLRTALVGAVALAVVVLVAFGAGLREFLFPGDVATARSDRLRVSLIEAGLEFWRESPWTGIGAGRYESLLKSRRPDLGVVTAMHNGFVELLVEYGAFVAAALAVLVVVVASRAVLPRRGGLNFGPPRGIDDQGSRHLLLVYLAGFALGGILISTPLPLTMWWMLLGSAVGAAWSLGPRRGRPAARP